MKIPPGELLTYAKVNEIISKSSQKNDSDHGEAMTLRPFCKGLTLDVGCGFEKVIADSMGVDLLDTGEAGEFGCMDGMNSIADICASGDDLYMFPDNFFDTVVNRHVIEHFEDPVKALAEWLRVLKPGGTLAMVIPDDDNADMLHVDPTHKHAMTRKYVQSLFDQIENETQYKIKITRFGDTVVTNWSFLVVLKKLFDVTANLLFLTTDDIPNYGPDSVFIGFKNLGYNIEDTPIKKTLHTVEFEKYPFWPQVIKNFPLTKLDSYDLVIAETRTDIDPPSDIPLIVIDGEDQSAISRMDLYEKCLLYFKREFTKDTKQYSKCLPLPFGLVRNYELGDKPIKHRKIDIAFLMGPTSQVRTDYYKVIEQIKESNKHLNIVSNLEPIPYSEYVSTLKDSKIGISLRGAGWDTYRYWEIPFCGAVLFSETLQIEIPNNFVKGQEAEFFNNPEELSNLIDLYLSEQDLLQQMQEKCRDKLLKHHTVEARASFIIEEYNKSVSEQSDKINNRIDLGCGKNKPSGYIGIDKIALPGVDIEFDIASDGIPFPDSSVSEVRAHDFLEHIEDKIFIMNEIYRVLKPNGLADIFVPSTDGRGAFQDPTHVSFWNENSFKYYVENDFLESFNYYGQKCRFKVEELFTTPMTEDMVCHVVAKLRAVK